jgi:hypothetical protein
VHHKAGEVFCSGYDWNEQNSKAQLALFPKTKFHIQKCNTFRVLEGWSRALKVELSNPRVRAARAACMPGGAGKFIPVDLLTKFRY